MTSKNWNLVRGLKETQDFKQEEILLLAMEMNYSNIEWHS